MTFPKTLIIFEIYLLMALLQRYVSALAARRGGCTVWYKNGMVSGFSAVITG